jgi:SAM-dependent methyltransferase
MRQRDSTGGKILWELRVARNFLYRSVNQFHGIESNHMIPPGKTPVLEQMISVAGMDTNNPRDTAPAVDNAWDCAYATQGRLWGGLPFHVPGLPDKARVLELGCGNGMTTGALAGKQYDLVALDFSPHACRLARNALKGHAPVDVLTADARTIPLRSGSVDVVVAHHVAGHLREKDRTLMVKEAARVLKGGGRFLFCAFSVEDFRVGKGTEVEPQTYRRGNGIITHYFTEAEIGSLSDRFIPDTIRTHRWSMKVRGGDHTRAEIIASFTRI